MYVGPLTETLPLHIDRYIVGLGTIRGANGAQQRTLYRYQCETCGREARVLNQAEEPFYCRCQALIDIKAAPTKKLQPIGKT